MTRFLGGAFRGRGFAGRTLGRGCCRFLIAASQLRNKLKHLIPLNRPRFVFVVVLEYLYEGILLKMPLSAHCLHVLLDEFAHLALVEGAAVVGVVYRPYLVDQHAHRLVLLCFQRISSGSQSGYSSLLGLGGGETARIISSALVVLVI